MTITQLISELIIVRANHGDVEVVHHGQHGGDFDGVEEVVFDKEENVVHLY